MQKGTVTRRAALLGVLAAACGRRVRAPQAVPAGDTEFRVADYGQASGPLRDWRYFWPHGDETTARDVLLEFLQARRGQAVLTTSRVRTIPVNGGVVDPNRILSRVGAERSLRQRNPQWSDSQVQAALTLLDRQRAKLTGLLAPPPGGLLLAMHNNSRGYTIKDELAGSDQHHLPQPDAPHDFILCVQPADYAKLARGPHNVVLQSAAEPDDGSLSRFAARNGWRYVNIEAKIGNRAEQTALLRFVVQTLTT